MKMVLTDVPEARDREAIVSGLIAHNEGLAGPRNWRPLAVLLRADDDQPQGGLWGGTAYGWLFVELVYVPQPLRGTGLGRELLARAEAEARLRGCQGVWLDTYEFQARGFYERLGFELFGRIDDYPPGFARFFLKKVFQAERPP